MMETFTFLTGHIDGMLDRDQRTAKLTSVITKFVSVLRNSRTGSNTTSSDWTVPKQNISHHRHRSLPGRTSPHSSSKTRKNINSWKSLQSLLVVALIVISSLVPSTLAAPLSKHSKKRMARQADIPMWVNPCGFAEEGMTHHEIQGLQQMSDEQLLDNIITGARTAKDRAEADLDAYVSLETLGFIAALNKVLRYFQTDPKTLHESRKDWKYDWLPSKNKIPMEWGEPIPTEHLQSLMLNEALLDTYEDLQRIAVGLEQIIWDEEHAKGEFSQAFRSNERSLKQVLCEIQSTLKEKGVRMRPDIDREIMPNNYRKLDSDTEINNRNWIILRDYLNTLEYIQKSFEHLKLNLHEPTA